MYREWVKVLIFNNWWFIYESEWNVTSVFYFMQINSIIFLLNFKNSSLLRNIVIFLCSEPLDMQFHGINFVTLTRAVPVISMNISRKQPWNGTFFVPARTGKGKQVSFWQSSIVFQKNAEIVYMYSIEGKKPLIVLQTEITNRFHSVWNECVVAIYMYVGKVAFLRGRAG